MGTTPVPDGLASTWLEARCTAPQISARGVQTGEGTQPSPGTVPGGEPEGCHRPSSLLLQFMRTKNPGGQVK